MDLLHALFRWICATISANFHFESHFHRKNTLWWMKAVQLAGKRLKCVTLIRGGFKCTKCPSIQPVRKTLCRARGANCQTKKPISTFETGTRISVFQFLISRRKTRINFSKPNALQWVFFEISLSGASYKRRIWLKFRWYQDKLQNFAEESAKL